VAVLRATGQSGPGAGQKNAPPCTSSSVFMLLQSYRRPPHTHGARKTQTERRSSAGALLNISPSYPARNFAHTELFNCR
jgi:hypothetical protein